MIEVEQVRELLSKATPGPWAYRSWEHDDWGIVRSADGHITGRAKDTAVEFDAVNAHRAAGTDPYEGNARLIAAAPDIAALALAQAGMIEELRAALERVDALTAEWFKESDALFDALPADPVQGVKQAARAGELEARADKLYAVRWGQQ